MIRRSTRIVYGLVALVAAVVNGGGSMVWAADAPAPKTPRRTRAPGLPVLTGRVAPPVGPTNCGACHTEDAWSAAKFDHRPTGFPLLGAHEAVACQACHPRDFRTRVADTCGGCHRDRHAGQLGMHCEGCHDERSWRETRFDADGHRSTAFPLNGRHAAIPCQECHGDLRDRSFSRAPLGCVDCHRADVAAAALRSIDHTAANFGTACQSCHTTWAFFPARFLAHDGCFPVSTGPHRPLRCSQCHANPAAAALTGLCSSRDVRCVSCHSHSCALSDRQHQNVMGYECTDQKCFECHRPVAAR